MKEAWKIQFHNNVSIFLYACNARKRGTWWQAGAKPAQKINQVKKIDKADNIQHS
jgi:hypothetical protein